MSALAHKLLGAAIADRACFDALASSGEVEHLPEILKLVYTQLAAYYERDAACTSADPAVLGELASAGMTNPKHKQALRDMLTGLGAEAPSTPNIQALIREAARDRVGHELSVALVSQRDQAETLALITQYSDLCVESAPETETTWQDVLAKRVAHKDQIPLPIKSLNDKLGGGLRPGHSMVIYARPECVAGSTPVRIAYDAPGCRASLTLAELHARFNGTHWLKGEGPYKIQACDPAGRVSYVPIEHVTASGIKEVYRVTTRRGFALRATAEHEVLLASGEYVAVQDLEPGDCVRTDRTEAAPRRARAERCGMWPGSPYKQRMVEGRYGPYHRAKEHRLALDAALNYLSLEQFVDALEEGRAASLTFSDQALDVHHINGDHEDNSPKNLRLVSRAEHTAHHAQARDVGNGHFADPDEVLSIDPAGSEECYDLGVEGPNKNFRAGGVYVHNCGKTALVLTLAVGMAKRGYKVLYLANEDPAPDLMVRAIQCLTKASMEQIHKDPTGVEQAALARGIANLKIRELCPGSLAEVEKCVREDRPQVLIVDQMRNVLAKSENTTGRMDLVAQGLRSIAKRYRLALLSTTQAGDSASGKAVLDMSDIDQSKTGVAGACDVLIGIGVTQDMENAGLRMLSFAKNKLTGSHGHLQVRIDPALSRISSYD